MRWVLWSGEEECPSGLLIYILRILRVNQRRRDRPRLIQRRAGTGRRAAPHERLHARGRVPDLLTLEPRESEHLEAALLELCDFCVCACVDYQVCHDVVGLEVVEGDDHAAAGGGGSGGGVGSEGGCGCC